jgi:hypothetical protein
MTTLRIDLQDRFAGDEVRIAVDGRQVFHKRGVTTKLLLGLADSVQVPVAGKVAVVEIAVPSRKLSRTERVGMKGDTFLGVSLSDRGIDVIVSDKPFGYA